jgi:hypothetical protein
MRPLFLATCAALMIANESFAAPLGNAFTYQGQLIKNSTPYAGNADFIFRLWNDASVGTQVGSSNGETWIGLPSWFESLNESFRYQLTPIGAAAPNLHVAQKIRGDRFQIAGGASGMEVSWQVTGVRQDAFAKANPMRVEIEKEGSERGRHLHPEAFGRPEVEGVDYQKLRATGPPKPQALKLAPPRPPELAAPPRVDH